MLHGKPPKTDVVLVDRVECAEENSDCDISLRVLWLSVSFVVLFGLARHRWLLWWLWRLWLGDLCGLLLLVFLMQLHRLLLQDLLHELLLELQARVWELVLELCLLESQELKLLLLLQLSLQHELLLLLLVVHQLLCVCVHGALHCATTRHPGHCVGINVGEVTRWAWQTVSSQDISSAFII